MSELKICYNCGWEGSSDEMSDAVTCPECDCEGYLDTSEEEY